MSKEYYFVKPTKAVQLGHLYEHLVMIEVVNALKNHGLYEHVDYSVVGKVYRGGMIYIDCSLYTELSLDFAKLMRNIKIDYDKWLDIAISMIHAEHRNEPKLDDRETVIRHLKTLHAKPWTELDNLGIVDASEFEDKPKAIESDDKSIEKVKVDKLSLTVRLNNHQQNAAIGVLSSQVLKIVQLNAGEEISNQFGLFSYYDYFDVNEKQCKLTNVYIVGNIKPDIKKCLETSISMYETLKENGVFERLLNQLQNLDLAKNAELFPNFENNYERTMVFVGSKGWKEAATKENLNAILNDLTLEIKMGKSKVTKKL